MDTLKIKDGSEYTEEPWGYFERCKASSEEQIIRYGSVRVIYGRLHYVASVFAEIPENCMFMSNSTYTIRYTWRRYEQEA